jgi:hypothetical protein
MDTTVDILAVDLTCQMVVGSTMSRFRSILSSAQRIGGSKPLTQQVLRGKYNGLCATLAAWQNHGMVSKCAHPALRG